MQITKLTRTKNGKRVNIYVDGKYSFTVSDNLLVKYGLHKGQKLSASDIEKISLEDWEEKLIYRCIERIAARPRSEQEVAQYIAKQVYKQTEKKLDLGKLKYNIIQKLKEKKYLNDEEFAKWWIKNRLAFKNKSKTALRSELSKKGVNGDIIERCLAEFVNRDEQEQAVKELAEKYIRQKSTRYERNELKQKTIAYLLRKGFSWEIVSKQINILFQKDTTNGSVRSQN